MVVLLRPRCSLIKSFAAGLLLGRPRSCSPLGDVVASQSRLGKDVILSASTGFFGSFRTPNTFTHRSFAVLWTSHVTPSQSFRDPPRLCISRLFYRPLGPLTPWQVEPAGPRWYLQRTRQSQRFSCCPSVSIFKSGKFHATQPNPKAVPGLEPRLSIVGSSYQGSYMHAQTICPNLRPHRLLA